MVDDLTATQGPALIKALVPLFTTGLAVSEAFEVVHGYRLNHAAAGALIIGVTGIEGVPSFRSEQAPMGGGTFKRVEEITVNCSLEATPTGEDLQDTMDYLSDRFDDVSAVINANRQVGECEDVHLGSLEATGADTATGDAARFDFSIVAQAYVQ